MGELTQRFVTNVQGVLERMLVDASGQGERSWSVLRIVVGLGLVVLHLTRFRAELLAGDPREVAVFTSVLGSVVASVALLGWLRTHPATERLLHVSVALDALIIGASTLAHVWMPYEGWAGLPRHPQVAFLYLITAAAGLRLSRRVALSASVGLTTIGAVLLGLDRALNQAMLPAEADIDLIYACLLQLGSCAFGITIASRTRQLVFSGARATMDAERARQFLGAYVSEEIAAVAMDAEHLELGGSRQSAAVLFTDLRGFTRYSEHREPEEVVSQLNAYLEAMVAPIRIEGGVVDKYIGDSIMAVFGIPASQGDDAARAIRAADAMQRAMRRLNHARTQAGLEPFRQGIGVHFGPVVAGNVGTVSRLQYTVIGDTVNTASRLEGATKPRAIDVLISAETVQAARDSGARLPRLVEAGTVELRGRDTPMAVFTLAED